MPSLAVHCAISLKRTGFDFERLHQWMDNPPEARSLGPDHRIIHHTFESGEMERIREFWEREKGLGWGEKAVVEWLFHIAVDNLSTAFKFSQNCYGENTYNLIHVGIEESGFVHTDFERVPDSRLRDAFRE